MTEQEKITAIVKALDSKKAEDIRVIKITDLTIIADYFVIAGGTSTTHTKALADETEFKLGELGVKPDHIEGVDGASWIAMDFGDIIVHVFCSPSTGVDTRAQYSLEKLWSDGEVIDISGMLC